MRKILADLQKPVAAIEASVTHMESSYRNFENIALKIEKTFNDLYRIAPDLHKDLGRLNDDQKKVIDSVSISSENMQKAADAIKEMAEPFRNEGIDKIVQAAAERMKNLEILQKGISQQQLDVYEQQGKLRESVNFQLNTLNQQVKDLQKMRHSQSQVDIVQVVLTLEQAGYSLQKKSALAVWAQQRW